MLLTGRPAISLRDNYVKSKQVGSVPRGINSCRLSPAEIFYAEPGLSSAGKVSGLTAAQMPQIKNKKIINAV